MVIFAPIVPHAMKEEWENYTSNHNYWIQQDLRFVRNGQETDPGNIHGIQKIPDEIDTFPTYNVDNESKDTSDEDSKEEETGVEAEPSDEDSSRSEIDLEDVYVPIWQYGPGIVNASLVNFDLFSSPTHSYVIGESFEVRRATTRMSIMLAGLNS